MTFRAKLNAFQRRRGQREQDGRAPTAYPGWEVLGGAVREDDWLARHGFTDPLAALRAGVLGPFLELAALEFWLRVRSHAPAGEAVAAGALAEVPPELDGPLREQVLGDSLQEAGAAILSAEWLVAADAAALGLMGPWPRLRDRRAGDPDAPPGDALLAEARQLAQAARQARRARPGC